MQGSDMPVCYISGPYTADTMNEVYENIQRARETALFCWEAGYGVICPHMNTAFMDGDKDHEKWLEGDLAIIDRLRVGVDFLVMLDGWEMSNGAVEERTFLNQSFRCFRRQLIPLLLVKTNKSYHYQQGRLLQDAFWPFHVVLF